MKLTPEQLAEIRDRNERELEMARELGFTIDQKAPAHKDRDQLLDHITALEAEKAHDNRCDVCQGYFPDHEMHFEVCVTCTDELQAKLKEHGHG